MFISPHSPNGKKFRSKPQLVRYLGDTVDLTTFDYKTGKINAILLRKNRKKAQPDLARGFRNDLSVIPPIRQTASIFKQVIIYCHCFQYSIFIFNIQPVTIVKSQECKVRHELKHGRQEKPRQVYSIHTADEIKTRTSPFLVSAAFLGETIGEPQISEFWNWREQSSSPLHQTGWSLCHLWHSASSNFIVLVWTWDPVHLNVVYTVTSFVFAHGHPRSVDNWTDRIQIGLGKERRSVSQPWSASCSGL